MLLCDIRVSFCDGLGSRCINGIGCWSDGYDLYCDENVDFSKSRFRKIDASLESCLFYPMPIISINPSPEEQLEFHYSQNEYRWLF